MKKIFMPLFEPLVFTKGLELKNRLVMAPLTTFSANHDGTVSNEEIEYYIRRSTGVGMVITACTHVTENGKGFSGQFSSTNDQMIPSLKRLSTAIKSNGAKAILQIFHAGRLASPEFIPDRDVVSASDYYEEGSSQKVARMLHEEEILNIIYAFAETTRRAIQAGYDGVEVHGANFYLPQQFFSAHTNHRNDKWGGAVQKRLRFPLMLIEEIQKVVKEEAKEAFLIGYRFSPEEPFPEGITMEDTFSLIEALINKDIDYLHVSLHNFWSKPRRGGDSLRTRIEQIQEHINGRVPLIGVGNLLSAQDVLQAKQTGVSLVALGRGIIMDPEWVEKIQNGVEEDIMTEVSVHNQNKLDIPSPLWDQIIHTPNWFPIKKEEAANDN
ncbi:NADH-dependent flavin oxidoreductase [Bacillus thuringiensis]|uniref:NADH-dependent flavin oxidoreductase n=1 Tax=Bacillus thuringiensis TaxID=1428 RepID=UPI001FAD81C4